MYICIFFYKSQQVNEGLPTSHSGFCQGICLPQCSLDLLPCLPESACRGDNCSRVPPAHMAPGHQWKASNPRICYRQHPAQQDPPQHMQGRQVTCQSKPCLF